MAVLTIILGYEMCERFYCACQGVRYERMAYLKWQREKRVENIVYTENGRRVLSEQDEDISCRRRRRMLILELHPKTMETYWSWCVA